MTTAGLDCFFIPLLHEVEGNVLLLVLELLEEGDDCTVGRAELIVELGDFFDPAGNVVEVVLVAEALVHEDDGSVVIEVADDSTDGLVGGPDGLDLVPLLARHGAFLGLPVLRRL